MPTDNSNLIICTHVDVHVLTVYNASFITKDGKTIEYYKAVLKATKGVTEISITQALFEEIGDAGAGVFTVSFCYDIEHGKARLDTLQ